MKYIIAMNIVMVFLSNRFEFCFTQNDRDEDESMKKITVALTALFVILLASVASAVPSHAGCTPSSGDLCIEWPVVPHSEFPIPSWVCVRKSAILLNVFPASLSSVIH